MKMESTKYDQEIENLIKIINSIKNIYNKLGKLKIDSPEYLKYQEYLKIALEVENNIYKRIGSEILSSDHFINRFNFLLTRSDIKDKETIAIRFSGYITMSHYLNPFLSKEEDFIEAQAENEVIIKNQICMDYYKAMYYELIEKSSKVKANERKKLNIALNNLLFNNKVIANLVTNRKSTSTNGRERCLIFNHDKNTTDYLYETYCYQIINQAIIEILHFNNTLLKEIELRSALKLLTKNEIFQIINDYYRTTTQDEYYKNLIKNNENHDLISSILKDALKKVHKSEKEQIKTKKKQS